jgi:CRISPR-associated protein Cas10/Cmr2 subtype III-B
VNQIQEKLQHCIDELCNAVGNSCYDGFRKDYGKLLEQFSVDLKSEYFVNDIKDAISWDYAAIKLPANLSEYRIDFDKRIKTQYKLKDEKDWKLTDLVMQRMDLIDPKKAYKSKKEYSSGLWALFVQHLAHLRNEKKKFRRFYNRETSGKDKCTLTGFSAAIGPESHSEMKKFWEECCKKNSVILHKTEKLCPLGVIKRFFFSYYLEPSVRDSYDDKSLNYLRKYPSLEDISLAGFKYSVARLYDKSETAKNICETAWDLEEEAREVLDDERLRETKSALEQKCFIYYKLGILQKIKKEQDIESLEVDPLFHLSSVWFKDKLDLKVSNNTGSFDILLDKEKSGRLLELHRKFKKSCKEFLKETEQSTFEKAPETLPFYSLGKYYAIVFFDGDSLSKWLSGSLDDGVPDVKKVHPDIRDKYEDLIKKHLGEEKFEIQEKYCSVTPGYHKAISEALANFSLGLVKLIVEERFFGRLIYSGGDDVLAILPPERAFHCAKELRRVFSLDFADKESQEKQGYAESVITPLLMGHKATGSAGIVVCPLKYPFAYALEKARDAEKKAKENGRDSFCFELCNRSGNSYEFVDKWGFKPEGDKPENDKSESDKAENNKPISEESEFEYFTDFFLRQFTGYKQEGKEICLSLKFPYVLRESFKNLLQVQTGDLSHFNELFELEVQRILKQQQYAGSDSRPETIKVRVLLLEEIKRLLNSDLLKKDKQASQCQRFESLIQFFNFVLYMHRMKQEEEQ